MEALLEETIRATRDMQSFWGDQISRVFIETLKSQSFINEMVNSVETTLSTRELFDTNLSRWANLFQIVTKCDLNFLNQQLQEINVKIEKLTETQSCIVEQLKAQTALLEKIAAGKN